MIRKHRCARKIGTAFDYVYELQNPGEPATRRGHPQACGLATGLVVHVHVHPQVTVVWMGVDGCEEVADLRLNMAFVWIRGLAKYLLFPPRKSPVTSLN